MRQQCNWTVTTRCQSFIAAENITTINRTNIQIDAELFFGLLDKYVKAEARIANLSLELLKGSVAQSTTANP
jgi:hypothetical protein